MKIDKTIQQYKTVESLQEFVQAQMATILQISQKVKRLEEERDHLKELLASTVPIIKPESEVQTFTENDSEYICTVEIGKLKKITLERELTLEESRRLETYFKILTQVNSKKINNEKEVKKLSDGELLKLVEASEENAKN